MDWQNECARDTKHLKRDTDPLLRGLSIDFAICICSSRKSFEQDLSVVVVVVVVIYIQRVQVRLVALKPPEGYGDVPSSGIKYKEYNIEKTSRAESA